MLETQVDLLGDQVETLLSILGKIYMGLDHYSPILQHYPGVRFPLHFLGIFFYLDGIEHALSYLVGESIFEYVS